MKLVDSDSYLTFQTRWLLQKGTRPFYYMLELLRPIHINKNAIYVLKLISPGKIFLPKSSKIVYLGGPRETKGQTRTSFGLKFA